MRTLTNTVKYITNFLQKKFSTDNFTTIIIDGNNKYCHHLFAERKAHSYEMIVINNGTSVKERVKLEVCRRGYQQAQSQAFIKTQWGFYIVKKTRDEVMASLLSTESASC